jgi:molecular chaperone DnaK
MVKEAEQNAESDKKKREAVEAKNQAESLIHSTEKSLKDYGDKVSAEDKAAIETALADLKGVIEGDDAEAIKEKTAALAEASMKLGEAMYKASQAEAEAEANAEGGAAADKDDNVVDADFEEVKDDDQKSA